MLNIKVVFFTYFSYLQRAIIQMLSIKYIKLLFTLTAEINPNLKINDFNFVLMFLSHKVSRHTRTCW